MTTRERSEKHLILVRDCNQMRRRLQLFRFLDRFTNAAILCGPHLSAAKEITAKGASTNFIELAYTLHAPHHPN